MAVLVAAAKEIGRWGRAGDKWEQRINGSRAWRGAGNRGEQGSGWVGAGVGQNRGWGEKRTGKTGTGGEQAMDGAENGGKKGMGRAGDGWEKGIRGNRESRDWVGAGDEGEQELEGAGDEGNSGWREQGLEAVWSRALTPAHCVAGDNIMMVILISLLMKI